MLLRASLILLAVVLVFPAAAAGSTVTSAWAWPVDGEVITPYSNGSDPYAGGQHRGIDIASTVGTPVLAASAGAVTFAGTAGSSGLTVSVLTADGRFQTSYLHLSSISVSKGDRVGEGARVGAVGTTGKRSAAAPHLHFGVREAGSKYAYRDPLTLLSPRPAPPARDAPRGAPAPAPAPVRAAPRPEPRTAPLRRPRRVRAPAGRRIRVPGAGRLPRTVPGIPAAPLGAPSPIGSRSARRAVRRAPRSVPSPQLGPQGAPDKTAPTPDPSPSMAPSRRPTVTPPAAGRDWGLALACLGLLAAAACLGLRGRGDGAARGRLATALRPLGFGRH